LFAHYDGNAVKFAEQDRRPAGVVNVHMENIRPETFVDEPPKGAADSPQVEEV